MEGFTRVLEDANAGEAVRARDLLEAAGIPSKVRAKGEPDELVPQPPQAELRDLYVPRNLVARARVLLERV